MSKLNKLFRVACMALALVFVSGEIDRLSTNRVSVIGTFTEFVFNRDPEEISREVVVSDYPSAPNVMRVRETIEMIREYAARYYNDEPIRF